MKDLQLIQTSHSGKRRFFLSAITSMVHGLVFIILESGRIIAMLISEIINSFLGVIINL